VPRPAFRFPQGSPGGAGLILRGLGIEPILPHPQ
jgi:hypothetical protein